jgi:UDP-galactopyranose mutase
MNVSNLVVGAGISGSALANLIASERDEDVLVIDKRTHIAGNCYDYRDGNGIMVHKYGSHIFHTNDEGVWGLLKRFAVLNVYMHKVVALIDGIETTIPFNFDTIRDVFPASLAARIEDKLLSRFKYNTKIPIMEFMNQDDADLRFLAEYVYEKVFLHYSEKQWGYSPAEIDGAVTARVPVYLSRDRRYFQDKYQGIPTGGYTEMIGRMLDHPRIKVNLDTKFADVADTKRFSRIFYTGPVDELMDYKYGPLPYRSADFRLETHNVEHYQSNAVVNYPNNYDFTRIHEYKYYLNDISSGTVIAKEYPEPFESGRNERYYPIPRQENQDLYEKYLRDAKNRYKNMHFLGRLGDYKYYDMDKAVLRAMQVFKEVFK